MIFTMGQSEGRINLQKVGIVAIFITSSYLVNSLTAIWTKACFV